MVTLVAIVREAKKICEICKCVISKVTVTWINYVNSDSWSFEMVNWTGLSFPFILSVGEDEELRNISSYFYFVSTSSAAKQISHSIHSIMCSFLQSTVLFVSFIARFLHIRFIRSQCVWPHIHRFHFHFSDSVSIFRFVSSIGNVVLFEFVIIVFLLVSCCLFSSSAVFASCSIILR